MLVHKGIGVCTAIASTHPNPRSKVTLKACASERRKCTWRVVICVGSLAI
jgi:hypothetical protein